jgi:hypothetical protein
MMIKEPENCVRKLSKLINVNLTQEEVSKVVTCMDKKWALENIDPYLFEARTPLSPPASTRHKMSKSGLCSLLMPYRLGLCVLRRTYR